jgi:hypothetical protein
MKHQSEQDPSGAALANPERRDGRQGPRHVQHPCPRGPRGLRSAKVAHRGEGIEAALMRAVPRQVIHVYQDARSPWKQRPSPENWQQQAGSRG